MMPESDLVLIIEPILIVFGAGSVKDPLAEPLAHRLEISAVRPAAAFGNESGKQMRV